MGNAGAHSLSETVARTSLPPVSVIVPTIGRETLLVRCLQSISSARPGPEEIVVVDQSGGDRVSAAVERFARARVITTVGRGIGLAMNLGLAQVRSETVLVTHDDCTVAPSWVAVAWQLASEHPGALLTGRVLAAGNPEFVPSVRDDPVPSVWRGVHTVGLLYPNNMVLNRSMAIELGGFEERLRSASEDNDFCYRWLKAGHVMRYEPELVVHHHEWRSRREMRRLRLRYGRAQGEFYAKLLRQRDRNVVGWLRSDIRDLAHAVGARALGRRSGLGDSSPIYLAGLPIGLVTGWRRFRGEAISDTVKHGDA